MPSLARTCSRLILAMPLLACVPPQPATPYPTTAPLEGEATEISEPPSPTTVSFLDRSVDLSPFLEGFPYADFNPKLEHGRMFFMHTGERYVLRSLPLPQAGAAATPLEIDGAEAVCEVDWSTRSLWGVRLHPATNTLWLHADASNDEQMNLWRIDLAAPLAQRVPTQITNADYVYGWGFSEDDGHSQIAYLARTGQQAPYRTCLRLLDAQDPTREGADQEVVCDSPELTFTWSSPHFSPDGQQIYFAAQVQGDRKRVQIVEVDLRNAKNKPPRLAPITDVNVPRSSPDVLEGWAGEHLLYVSNEAGYGNIYSWSRRTRKHKRLTHHSEELLGAASLQVGSTHAVLVAHGTPAGSTLELLDASSGAVLGHATAPGKIGILDAHDGRAVWTQQAPDKVYEANLASFSKIDGELSLRNDTLIRPSAALESELVRCVPEAVKIPSFDGTLLHAFVLRPKQPLPDGQAIAMVRSFYGGDNEWTRHDHLLCAAGITVVSPAVRGSSGFGKAFAALNDRDLGGDEIVDLFWVARWIETELGIPSARVGVYGRSHGGYATMRAMTFPPETNDRNEAYGFGFGLAEAGFSDIVAFHDATNIPDWVVLEAGDPAVPEDLARLRDRSPINHVERLVAPIFLLHGANDWRVPVAGSRAFVEAAKAAGKSVSYLEVEGQGHHVEGQERIVEAWQARFDFIESVVASTP